VRAALPEACHERSLSALTWSVLAPARGFPLVRHNVFFGGDSAREFAALFEAQRLPEDPTVYVCAQDRGDPGDAAPMGAERLLCLVNAPARGDARPLTPEEIETCEQRTFARLARCGLAIERTAEHCRVTTPSDFHRLFPATGGALYGPASHGWRASFRRPTQQTKVPGLILCGGSTHPGPGVPMAALSGRLAARAVRAHLATQRVSMSPSRLAATPGGTSTR
jgi:1-hydroxycarotenoid 3,4-desaturase